MHKGLIYSTYIYLLSIRLYSIFLVDDLEKVKANSNNENGQKMFKSTRV